MPPRKISSTRKMSKIKANLKKNVRRVSRNKKFLGGAAAVATLAAAIAARKAYEKKKKANELKAANSKKGWFSGWF